MKPLMILTILSGIILASCASNTMNVSTEESLLNIAQKAQSTSSLLGEEDDAFLTPARLNNTGRNSYKNARL